MPVRIREAKVQPAIPLLRRRQAGSAAAVGGRPPVSSVPNAGPSMTAYLTIGIPARSPAMRCPAPASTALPTSGPDVAHPKFLTYRSRRPGLYLRQSFRHLCPGRPWRLHNVARRYRPQSLQNPEFYFIKPLTTIKYHAIPCLPMDGCSRWGELRRHLSGAPCRASTGERWGKKWHVSVHLREQGRPQGASFSAGDLSRLIGGPAFSGHRRISVTQISGDRRQRHRAHGGAGGPARDSRGIFRRARESGGTAVRPVAATPLRH